MKDFWNKHKVKILVIGGTVSVILISATVAVVCKKGTKGLAKELTDIVTDNLANLTKENVIDFIQKAPQGQHYGIFKETAEEIFNVVML